MITITNTMTKAQILTALNENFDELVYNGCLISTITELSDLSTLNANFNSIKNVSPLISSITELEGGMSGLDFVSTVNQNFANLLGSFNVKCDKPYLTLRFDDGRTDALTGYLPCLQGLGVVGFEAAWQTSALFYSQLRELQSEGWEIGSHGTHSLDRMRWWNNETIRSMLQTQKDTFASESISAVHYAGHDINNFYPPAYNLVTKIFKMNQVIPEPGSPVDVINTLNIDLKKIVAHMGDVTGYGTTYKIDTANGVSEFKSMLDAANNDNRWFVLVLHTWTAGMQSGLEELVTYAKGIGMTISTPSAVYANFIAQ